MHRNMRLSFVKGMERTFFRSTIQIRVNHFEVRRFWFGLLLLSLPSAETFGYGLEPFWSSLTLLHKDKIGIGCHSSFVSAVSRSTKNGQQGIRADFNAFTDL